MSLQVVPTYSSLSSSVVQFRSYTKRVQNKIKQESGTDDTLHLLKNMVFISTLPTMLVLDKENFLGRCCAIHVKPTKFSNFGCCDVNYGYHAAVQATFADSYYCDSEKGARILDYAFMYGSVVRSNSFVEMVVFDYSKLSSRFFRGTPVTVSVYGAGYCYLGLFHVCVRSRVARCLGPNPYLADVVRFMFSAYDRSNNRYIISMKSRLIHIDESGSGMFIRDVFDRFLAYLNDIPDIRIGGEDLTVDDISGFVNSRRRVVAEEEPYSISLVDTVGCDAVYLRPKISLFGDLDLVKLLGGHERASRLKAWFGVQGLDISCCIEDIMLSTVALAYLPNQLHLLKDVMKMWAVVGDSVLRTHIACYSLSRLNVPAQYTSNLQVATNVSLSKIFVGSGLVQCSEVVGLSDGSKSYADMLEMLIGIVYLNFGDKCVYDLLFRLGIVHEVYRGFKVASGVVKEDGVKSLNSRQLENAVCLAQAGLLDF